MKLFLTALVLALALPAVSRAETQKTRPSANASVNAATSEALSALHESNLMEIDMGKLAQDNGQSDGVRQFGKKLEQDHKDADDKTQKVAKAEGVALPDKDQLMAGAAHQKMETLKNLKGAAFDREFARMMAEDHKKDIASLEAALPKLTGQSAALLNEVLPKLREHEKIALGLVTNPSAASKTR